MAQEKDYYPGITRYYLANKPPKHDCVVWEAKLARTSSLAFSALVPHQEEHLLEAERAYGGKLPDVGISRKPFDGYVVYKAWAVVIAIYFLKHKSEAYEIPIRRWVEERYSGPRKSLTKDRAAQIGRQIVIPR
jgi:hypothetical protein